MTQIHCCYSILLHFYYIRVGLLLTNICTFLNQKHPVSFAVKNIINPVFQIPKTTVGNKSLNLVVFTTETSAVCALVIAYVVITHTPHVRRTSNNK